MAPFPNSFYLLYHRFPHSRAPPTIQSKEKRMLCFTSHSPSPSPSPFALTTSGILFHSSPGKARGGVFECTDICWTHFVWLQLWLAVELSQLEWVESKSWDCFSEFVKGSEASRRYSGGGFWGDGSDDVVRDTPPPRWMNQIPLNFQGVISTYGRMSYKKLEYMTNFV